MFFDRTSIDREKNEGKTHLLTSTAFATSIVGLDRIHFQTQDTLLKGELQNLKVQDGEKSGDGMSAWVFWQ